MRSLNGEEKKVSVTFSKEVKKVHGSIRKKNRKRKKEGGEDRKKENTVKNMRH